MDEDKSDQMRDKAETKEDYVESLNLSSPASDAASSLTIKRFERISSEQAAEIKRLRLRMSELFEAKGTEHPESLDTVTSLAGLLYDTLQFPEAEAMYERALKGRSANLGFAHTGENTHIMVNTITARLALCLCKNRKFAESESMLTQSLSRVQQEFGYEHPETLSLVEGLGDTKRELGKYDESEVFWKRSLKYHERVDGPESEQTLHIVNTLADLYTTMNNVPAALALCENSLQYCTRTLGPFHPTTQKCVAILAQIRYSQGQVKEAEEMYRLAWACQEEKLGRAHDDTLQTMSLIAELLTDRQDWLKAELMRRDLLERCESAYGDDHPRSLEQVHHLGVLVLRQEQMIEAETLLRRSLVRRLEFLGDEHPHTNDTRHFVAKLLFIQLAWRHSPLIQARTEECETLLNTALKHREADFQKGPNHADTIDTCQLLADFYFDHPFDPQYKRAEKLLERVLANYVSRFSKTHRATNDVRYQLAVCRMRMRSFAAASELFLEARNCYIVLFGGEKGSTVREREIIEDAWDLHCSAKSMAEL